ncbi:hypothetical protein RRG08_051174 [Elysia crispata]|uniref:C-type lectin domain-containing protein n=1 Tax=Elysia crispata TaxID=231223 RepID=A0AAE0YMP1_9GAST|nr:hypothetical protein RRG08_051174 [Elysia crispata]
MEKTIILLWLTGFQVLSGQGVFDPCYFWPGSVYAGDGMCFKFVDQNNTFNDSQTSCKTDGATLAEVRNQQQKDTVKSFISGSEEVWLGGWHPSGGSNFVWLSDRENVSSHVTDAFYNQGTGGEPICLIMNSTELAPQSCENNLTHICQIYAGNPCDVYLPGGEYYDNNCFLPVAEQMTLQDATLHCEKQNGKVVEPSIQKFITYVTHFAEWNFAPGNNVWLGLIHLNNRFMWQSTAELVTATNWVNGDPGTSELTADSAVVMNGSSGWVWEVVSKSDTAGVICQRDLIGECNGVFSSGRCFNIHPYTTDWYAAKAACQEEGSYLAEPKTEILARTVEKYVIDTPNVAHVFLGATDLETKGTFVWDHSGQYLRDTYQAWGIGQPNNYGGNQNFLQYLIAESGWNDISVNASQRPEPPSFLCEQVIRVYLHSYVTILPRKGWGGPASRAKAMLSVASFPSQQGHNHVEFSTFPSGDLKTISLFENEVYQYYIDIDGLSLNSSGLQKKYVRVKSTDHLDVHFFIWGKGLWYACSSLILEEITPGWPTAFFSNPGQKESSLAILFTEEEPSSLDLVFSSYDETFTIIANSMNTQNRQMLLVSTSFTEEYQSLYVDRISGSSSPQVVHSNGAMSVYRFDREYKTNSNDRSCDQVLPISMIGSDYITFPSLPMNASVTDHYTIVAVYKDTKITVFNPDSNEASMKINLQWPGDVFDLQLPASTFYHVNGTNAFYLYARLAGSGGFCTVALMQESLFRSSYQLAVVGPLEHMTDIFVVVIVKTQDKVSIIGSGPGSGVQRVADNCKDVAGTEWSGCYFHIRDTERNESFVIEVNSSSTSLFGAYLFSTGGIRPITMCFHLGMPTTLPNSPIFDFDEYLSTLKTKRLNLCNKEITSTPLTGNTQKVENFTTEQIHHNATSQLAGLTFTSEASKSDLGVTTEQNTALSSNEALDISTRYPGNPATFDLTQTDTSAVTNNNVDISSLESRQFDTSTATYNTENITPSGSHKSATTNTPDTDLSSSGPPHYNTSTASNGVVDDMPSGAGAPQFNTPTASNDIVDNTSSRPTQFNTSIASNGIVDNTSSGPPRCREVRIPQTNKTLTSEEVEETVEKIIMNLIVNRGALSSVKRSKISAPDNRVSSTTMGLAGIVFTVLVFGLIFISDISKLVHDFRLAFGNIKKPSR